jgi:glycosyltransferase involved in cell wall biosynthesis
VIRLDPSTGTSTAATQRLTAALDVDLPRTLTAARQTALFVCGWCVPQSSPVVALELDAGAGPVPSAAHGMPRGDVLEALSPDAPDGSLESGFWGILPIEDAAPGDTVVVKLRARLADGGVEEAELGRIEVEPPVARAEVGPPGPGTEPFVVVAMATHEPSPPLLRRQLDSLRTQTHRNWVCVMSDDCSSPHHLAAIEAAIDDDPRFLLSRSPARLGFYANFERALSLVPAGADFVAMADQDDRWEPDKLERLLWAIGDAQLVYSDARIVDTDGELLADSYWKTRRNNHEDISSVLMANSVTGAASLFPRSLLDVALPFPPGQFHHFHDHWIGLCALSLGEIGFVPAPLYDYVQHRAAVLGHAKANTMPTLGERVRGWRRPLRDRVRLWRLTYFVDACRLLQFATILLRRCGDRMPAEKRRALERFLNADRSPAELGWLAARAGRELVGKPETLGAELGLFFGFAWRHALRAVVRVGDPPRRLRLDSRPPPRLALKPGQRGPDSPSVRLVSEKLEPLDLAVNEGAPERVNILIPKIDLKHFFGGYIGKLNLARRLAERGARVRVVTVDPVGPLVADWRDQVERYAGLAGVFERVEVSFGREVAALEVSRADRFVATTWWTAHLAKAALDELDRDRFLYLIQEYEPFTFPMGSLAALAHESYSLPHRALFSTELLRDFFRGHGYGVYADGTAAGDAGSVSFENAITDVRPPGEEELAARETRRLLFYARPEPHASRNMFELGALALARAVEEGILSGWELYGIGSLEDGPPIQLGGGALLELVGRRGQDEYARLLREHDVGLALMYTPHPSLPPIEMAAAGMLTVTNSFENKSPSALAAISPNLIAVEPTVDEIVSGLREAVDGSADPARRVSGSRVNWSRSWSESFPDQLVERLEAFLDD